MPDQVEDHAPSLALALAALAVPAAALALLRRTPRAGTSRVAGLLLGVALDALLGDPRRGHPVALLGSLAAAWERRLYDDTAGRGAVHLLVVTVPVVALGVTAEALTRGRPLARTAVVAAGTWTVLGARSLVGEGLRMAAYLEAGDLKGARRRLSHLCGRDPDGLEADELARAVVESLAENTCDAVTAPLWWGMVGGLPGLLAHRAVNTLDAMVGHHNPRYERFGRTAAQLDDLLAWMPARITGALASLAAPAVGGSRRTAWRTMRRDGRHHPSPNGGWCEAAWAGALGVRLGGRNRYRTRVEVRGTLGDPDAPPPDAAGVRRAAILVGTVTALAAAGAAMGARAWT